MGVAGRSIWELRPLTKTYLAQVEHEENEAMREIRSSFPLGEIRERLLAWRKPVVS